MGICLFTVLCHSSAIYDEQQRDEKRHSLHTDVEVLSSDSGSGDEKLKGKRKVRGSAMPGNSARGGGITGEQIDDPYRNKCH